MNYDSRYRPSPATIRIEAGASTFLNADEREETGAAADPRKLASRFWRLFAVVIDGLGIAVLELPLHWYLHAWPFAKLHAPMPYRTRMIIGAVYIVLFVIINYRLLDRRGQTIGKWFVGVTIVGLDGSNKGAVHLLIYRFLPAMLIVYVPLVGPFLGLADDLAIFGSQRRCIHDHIAGTRVVRTEPNP